MNDIIERQFMSPDDMWKRVENGNLLYVPVVTVHGADHAHVYLAGQMAREPAGETAAKGERRAQWRMVCDNLGKGLANAGATFDDVVRSTTYVTDFDEYYPCSAVRFEYSMKSRPVSALIQLVRLGDRDSMVEI